ncbi:hypothetical protein LSM04_003235 [Trypanosoma melophagium]|uniref:uncharacterized protein n=1 Tax=Trypanosoma melophagium TaxID=715481 RepID=UPI00351A678B|nr:hypothetical protein LSM04_003235 [Trypanosoma melophagium]
MRRFGVVTRWSFLLLEVPPPHLVVPVTAIRAYHVQSAYPGVVPAISSSWCERVRTLFSDGFKGMENFHPEGSGDIQRNSIASSPPPPPPPSHTAMNTLSSSLPSTFCNAATQKTLTARDLFPDTQSLFPDVRLVTTPSTSWAKVMGVQPMMRVKHDSERADVGQHGQNYSQQPQSGSFPRISQATNTSATASSKEYEDAKRYAYAYEIWRQRNEILQQMELDLMRLKDGVQYLRSLQEEDLERTMKRATKFSFFVFFPFVLLTTIILFIDAAFYNAELKHLRLVDYDAWLKKQGGEVASSETIPKIRK